MLDRYSGAEPHPHQTTAKDEVPRAPADFLHKLGIVLKELNETSIWLRIIERSDLLSGALLRGIIEENKSYVRFSLHRLGLRVAAGNDK